MKIKSAQSKKIKRIATPLDKKTISRLKAGEEVLLSGIIYTARDQAHKRMVEAIRNCRRLPFDLKGALIYYCGPTGTPRGKVIGACGPTTSSRMDAFTPPLLKRGLAGMIGKGTRSAEVSRAIRKNKAVYFLAHAGCAALLSQYVKKSQVIAFKDLGPEAIRRLVVEDFPLIVGIDSGGGNIHAEF